MAGEDRNGGPAAARDAGPIRVLLVDDHRVVREGLRAFFSAFDDIVVVGEARDGTEALDRVQALLDEDNGPDCVLIDLLMEPMDGIEATRRIKQRHPEIEVVAMTSFVDEEKVLAALEAGAQGYLLKDAEPEQVADAVRAAHRGEVAINARMAALLVGSLRDRRTRADAPVPKESVLTGRERQILIRVARGASNRAIAEDLVISERTVRTHVSNVLSKLALSSRTQAALFAVREGLMSDE